MAKKHSLVNNKGKKSCRHQEPGLTIDIGCSYSSTLGIYIGSPWHLIKRAGQLRLWLPHHLCPSAEGTAWRSFEHAYPKFSLGQGYKGGRLPGPETCSTMPVSDSDIYKQGCWELTYGNPPAGFQTRSIAKKPFSTRTLCLHLSRWGLRVRANENWDKTIRKS